MAGESRIDVRVLVHLRECREFLFLCVGECVCVRERERVASVNC